MQTNPTPMKHTLTILTLLLALTTSAQFTLAPTDSSRLFTTPSGVDLFGLTKPEIVRGRINNAAVIGLRATLQSTRAEAAELREANAAKDVVIREMEFEAAKTEELHQMELRQAVQAARKRGNKRAAWFGFGGFAVGVGGTIWVLSKL